MSHKRDTEFGIFPLPWKVTGSDVTLRRAGKTEDRGMTVRWKNERESDGVKSLNLWLEKDSFKICSNQHVKAISVSLYIAMMWSKQKCAGTLATISWSWRWEWDESCHTTTHYSQHKKWNARKKCWDVFLISQTGQERQKDPSKSEVREQQQLWGPKKAPFYPQK